MIATSASSHAADPGPAVLAYKLSVSPPHFHPNDPESTRPMPAGSFVVHYGGKEH